MKLWFKAGVGKFERRRDSGWSWDSAATSYRESCCAQDQHHSALLINVTIFGWFSLTIGFIFGSFFNQDFWISTRCFWGLPVVLGLLLPDCFGEWYYRSSRWDFPHLLSVSCIIYIVNISANRMKVTFVKVPNVPLKLTNFHFGILWFIADLIVFTLWI